jgi:hypothetical protein
MPPCSTGSGFFVKYPNYVLFKEAKRKKRNGVKNAVFWVVTPCDSYINRRFGGPYPLHHQGDNNRRARDVSSN